MRSELYKIFNSHIFYLLILLVVLSVMGFSIHYLNNEYHDIVYVNPEIQEYSDIDDLENLITKVTLEIQNINPDSSNYENELKRLHVEKDIYEYLKINFKPYNQLYEYDMIRDYRSDSLSFNNWSVGMMTFIGIIVAAVFSLFIMSMDYLYKTNVHLYNTFKSKKKILFDKYLSFLVFLIFIYILMYLISLVFANTLSTDKTQLLLVGSQIRSIDINLFIVGNVFSGLFKLLFIGSLFFFISAIIRDIFFTMVVMMVFISIFGFYLPYTLPNHYLLQLMQTSLNLYAKTVQISTIVWYLCIQLTILVLLSLLGFYSFAKQKTGI